MDIDEFREIVSDEIDLLPDYCFKDLSGGIVVSERCYLHPARVKDDLYIMGTYTTNAITKQVTIYYGSFVKTIYNMDERKDFVRKKIREVLRHEFQHHLENLAGMHGKNSLEGEDRKRMMDYYTMHGYEKEQK